jgi:anti-sigma factor RsiW
MSDPHSMAAAEYVLGTLDASERQEFERRLASDPLLRAQVAEWQANLDPLAQSIEPIEPSVALWHRIDTALDQIEREDNVVSIKTLFVRRPTVRPRVAAVVFGAIAASIVAVALVPHLDGLSSKSERPPVQAVAPSSTLQSPTKAASAPPCPTERQSAVQTTRGPNEASTQREASSGAVAVASAVRDQGAVIVGGHVATGETQQPSKPEGPRNVTVASAENPGCK